MELAASYIGMQGPNPEVSQGPNVFVKQDDEQQPRLWAPGPEVVPSQWKLGAALDRVRFPQYGGDWDTMMASVTGRAYERTFPRSSSPLSEDDMAREWSLFVIVCALRGSPSTHAQGSPR